MVDPLCNGRRAFYRNQRRTRSRVRVEKHLRVLHSSSLVLNNHILLPPSLAARASNGSTFDALPPHPPPASAQSPRTAVEALCRELLDNSSLLHLRRPRTHR